MGEVTRITRRCSIQREGIEVDREDRFAVESTEDSM